MLSRSYVQAGAGGVSGVFLIDTFTKNVRPSARTLGPALAPPHPGLLNTIFSKLNNGAQLQPGSEERSKHSSGKCCAEDSGYTL